MSYDAVIGYVNDKDNWSEMEDELRSRGVCYHLLLVVTIESYSFIVNRCFMDLYSEFFQSYSNMILTSQHCCQTLVNL